jgi:hypothetical protein
MPQDLPLVDEHAEARIKVISSEAEYSLTREVMGFLYSCVADELKIPTSYDLVPFFVRYAETVFDAEVREYLKSPQFDHGLAATKLCEAAVRVRKTITKKGDGVWRRVVDLAVDYAGDCHETKAGYWDRTFFRRARWTALEAALTARAKLWESKLYASNVACEASNSVTSHLPQSGADAADEKNRQEEGANRQKPEIEENPLRTPVSVIAPDSASPKELLKSRKQRRDPHPDPESVFREHPSGLLYQKAAEVLGLSLRRVQDLVNKEGVLETTGTGHKKKIPVESLRKYLGPRKK